jgi:hypothetical protein
MTRPPFLVGSAFLQNAAKLLMDLERLVRSFAAKCWRSLKKTELRLLMGRLTSSFGGAAAAPQFRGVR